MPIQEEKLKKFQDLLRMVNESLTRKEFTESFQNIVNLVLKVEKSLVAKHDKNIAGLKELFRALESQIKTSTNAEVSTTLKELKDITRKALKEQDAGMSFMRDKLKEYAKQKAKDDEKLKNELLAQIPEIKETILDTPEKMRDKLESLRKDERIDISAIRGIEDEIKKMRDEKAGTGMYLFGGNRPLQIQENGTVKDKATRYINFTGATVTRDSTGVLTVAVTGGGGGVETPSGTQNGTNKIFTVLHTPLYLSFNGQNLYENNGYTLATLTITFDVAPASTDIIRSHF